MLISENKNRNLWTSEREVGEEGRGGEEKKMRQEEVGCMEKLKKKKKKKKKRQTQNKCRNDFLWTVFFFRSANGERRWDIEVEWRHNTEIEKGGGKRKREKIRHTFDAV